MELRITDVPSEMIEIGKAIVSEKSDTYSEEILESLRHDFSVFGGKETDEEDFVYRFVYDHWMYGVDPTEEITYGFANKTHSEKSGYLTWHNRFRYFAFLNDQRDTHLLDNKYEAYLKLKKFYKREAITVSEKDDLDSFREFVEKHGKVIVKPVNLYLTIGLRWFDAENIDDYEKVLDELLESAKGFAEIDARCISKPQVIVEELIEDGKEMPPFNTEMASLVRCTTILTSEGVSFFYPAFRTAGKVVKNENGIDYEKTDIFIAAVDGESGIITSKAYDYFGNIIEKHPLSGQRFEGTQLPDWKGLLEMLTEAAYELPTLRYVGWDVAYTGKGWCIIEGNTSGEFFSQMVNGHGYKREFEKLIGWKMPDKLWWQPWFGAKKQ